jgi:Fic-DOC domain mobile mystery protein B
MGLTLDYPSGATPLDPDEAAALIPRHISTQGQLNEWEHQNIVAGQQWAFSRKRKDLLTIEFMLSLHKKMFGDTWRWAGTFRRTEKSIGVAPEQMAVRLMDLFADVKTQLEYHSYPLAEVATRFHHRLVYIHPFPNGNGRLARMMTDILLVENGAKPFLWGEGDLISEGEVRNRYIAALRAADARDYGPLLEFLDMPGK